MSVSRFPLRATPLVKHLMVAAGLLCAGSAFAQGVPVYQTTDLIFGQEGKKYSFMLPVAPSFRADLTDFSNPEAFDFLRLTVAQGATNYGSCDAPGSSCSFTFSAGPGTYDALVFGKTGPAFSTGSFGLTISAVPEPEIWAMMAVGLGLVSYRLRRRSKAAQAV